MLLLISVKSLFGKWSPWLNLKLLQIKITQDHCIDPRMNYIGGSACIQCIIADHVIQVQADESRRYTSQALSHWLRTASRHLTKHSKCPLVSQVLCNIYPPYWIISWQISGLRNVSYLDRFALCGSWWVDFLCNSLVKRPLGLKTITWNDHSNFCSI